jgi:hypothetical protein
VTGVVFIPLNFLRNIRMGPISYSVTLKMLKSSVRCNHSSLMGPFVSYEKTLRKGILSISQKYKKHFKRLIAQTH